MNELDSVCVRSSYSCYQSILLYAKTLISVPCYIYCLDAKGTMGIKQTLTSLRCSHGVEFPGAPWCLR